MHSKLSIVLYDACKSLGTSSRCMLFFLHADFFNYVNKISVHSSRQQKSFKEDEGKEAKAEYI